MRCVFLCCAPCILLPEIIVPTHGLFFVALSLFLYIGEYDPPCDDHLDLWIGFLLDARTPARATTIATGKRKGNLTPSATTSSSSKASPAPSGRGTGSSRLAGKWKGPTEGWMRAEIVVVNPTEVVSAEGVQRYPKGTFGIR